MENLQKQLSIYSLDTASFYTKKEYEIHSEIEPLKMEMYLLSELLKLKGVNREKRIKEIAKMNDEEFVTRLRQHIKQHENIEKLKEAVELATVQKRSLKKTASNLRKSKKGKSRENKGRIDKLILLCKNEIEFLDAYLEMNVGELKNEKSPKKQLADLIEQKKTELKEQFDSFTGTRILREEALTIKNAVSLFDSVLTRTLQSSDDEGICEDIIIVQSYYYKVLEDLIVNGFINADGEPYVYFSSSAGQIRKKRGVWIKKVLWEQYENSLMCGLTREVINSKGGINLTKYQAYKALCNSASTEWKEFAEDYIDKCIVVDDLTVTINPKVDYIDYKTYKITSNINKEIPMEVTDGCGIMLPSVSKKSFQVRAPHLKGLLVPFPMDEFLAEHPEASVTVTDIYGDIHNLSDVSIIFTRSQFKMAGYYGNWKEYQDNFKKYNCQAAKLNEEDTSGNATLTYQMLQSLVDVEEDELREMAEDTLIQIESIGKDKDVMLEIMGANEGNPKKNFFQQALYLYPELLNDTHTKETIKSKRKSLIKDAKSAKLKVDRAKYTFIIPDLYAFAQKITGLEVTGLLKDGEVHCRMYEEGDMCVLRSPHLYREWGIRNNKLDEKMKKWYITDGLYTAIEDSLPKLLQYDHDGDKSLCIQNERITSVAKRNMEGILPLYYEMVKAKDDEINEVNLYKSLVEAYKARIGIVSNEVSKVWNSGKVDENALKVIKYLCMESNFQIDRAKTNFMTTRPLEVDEMIKSFTGAKTPYFFINAKNKPESKVEEISSSTVNRLEAIVEEVNKRIHFHKVAGKFDYKMLMKNKYVELDEDIIEQFVELDRAKNKMMKDEKYDNKEQLPVYKYIRRELLKVKNHPAYVADVLVKYLYDSKNSKYKTTLWEAFGKEIVRNIKKNVHNIMDCVGCRAEIKEPKKNQTRCEECRKKQDKENARLRKQKQRKLSRLIATA